MRGVGEERSRGVRREGCGGVGEARSQIVTLSTQHLLRRSRTPTLASRGIAHI